jgi:adenine-specific DNA-methyltransferase
MEVEAISVRYIGSKARVIDDLIHIAGAPRGSGVFVDAFCGTGVVAAAAADAGWAVRLNDNLRCAVTMAAARLLAVSDVPFSMLGGYASALDELRETAADPGFVWSEYTPAAAHAGAERVERRYFTEHNAARIDGMRGQIEQWRAEGMISPSEEILLVADLLSAANKVANIAGTYGCFLRAWQPTALADIVLSARNLRATPVKVEVQCGDVSSVHSLPDDLVYLDPPYTKRQYAAYYHILETIAVGDTPDVGGVTGLRPWKHLASPFCYKRRATAAIHKLITDLSSKHVLLSYSDDGHVDLTELIGMFSSDLSVHLHEVREIGRYRPNQTASNNSSAVTEYVVEVLKTSRTARATPST